MNILGVKPQYRRKGLGRFLLVDGMKWVAERGMDSTRIGVYAKNEKALDLYLSLGFEKDRSSLWLEKKLK